jgi:hypothetical protein
MSNLIDISALEPPALASSATMWLANSGAIRLVSSPTSVQIGVTSTNAGTATDNIYDPTLTNPAAGYGTNFTAVLYGTYAEANVCP